MNQIKVELQAVYGGDREIAEAAWTSSFDYQKKKQRSEEDVKRVVTMLADSKHSVPFESVILRFWIKMPIAIDRQYCTHRVQSSSGMSGRYRTMPSEFLAMPVEVNDILIKSGIARAKYDNICDEANYYYQDSAAELKRAESKGLITNKELKRAREFLRGVLPQHNMTERVSIMNLRSFANFIKLRNSEHAQLEIRQVAQLMLQSLRDSNSCPIALEALERNNWSI